MAINGRSLSPQNKVLRMSIEVEREKAYSATPSLPQTVISRSAAKSTPDSARKLRSRIPAEQPVAAGKAVRPPLTERMFMISKLLFAQPYGETPIDESFPIS